MKSKWSDEDAAQFVARYSPLWGEDLALRTYLARLIGSEESLVLHGGGNTSLKSNHIDVFGTVRPSIYVKASGIHMAAIEPEDYILLDLEYLRRLRILQQLSDEEMLREFLTHRLDTRTLSPSIETLVHAFLPARFIDHTHADAILALTNQPDGMSRAAAALGEDVILLEYAEPGFELAKAAASAFEVNPGARGMAWMRHGLVTWGDSARESYENTVEIITRAEQYIASQARHPLVRTKETPVSLAMERFCLRAPIVRGLLAQPTGRADHPYARVLLQPLINREVLDFVDSDRGREFALTPPLTCDHLIRIKPLPLWVDRLDFADEAQFRTAMSSAINDYTAEYLAYLDRHRSRLPQGVAALDPKPRVILVPGLGAMCAGRDAHAARIAADITAHTLEVKARIAAMGSYLGSSECSLFDMEYRALQHAKLAQQSDPLLSRQVAIVTGAAGAIGSAISEALLDAGCHVAVTDLPGDALTSLVQELRRSHDTRVIGVPLDVTDPKSVEDGFRTVVGAWGGADIVIINAGLALVASLEEMSLEAFRRLARVNVEGTLLLLGEAARHFRMQATGGDIVLISTKNVFAPGANFGAYSATKSAAHQLARIASQELAGIDVRVNMVSPDAVFGHLNRPSGLWQEVGPSRMAARGLDPNGLEEYYRSRNLLKAKVTARHVANAVLFFVCRETPTTGATLPVDGGLPDSTPR